MKRLAMAAAVAGLVLSACAGDGAGASDPGASPAASVAPAKPDAVVAAAPASPKLEISDATFPCIRNLTKVRGFYVGNIKGDAANMQATLAVANSAEGGSWPAGSIVQLVPGEAMVKHGKGFNPATNDWEFFELDTTATGTKIKVRGFTEAVNQFGGNCLSCHIKANPGRDLICETGHGCDDGRRTAEHRSALPGGDRHAGRPEAGAADPQCDAGCGGGKGGAGSGSASELKAGRVAGRLAGRVD
jgi:hypothetical protein